MSAVSVKVFQAVVAGAAAAGVPPDELLRAAGLAAADLADPDGRLPRACEVRLWQEAARSTGDDCFGLHLSGTLAVGDLGALGFAVRSSATVFDAYQRVARYLHVLAQGAVLQIHLDGDAARLRHMPPLLAPAPSRHAVEFLMANLLLVGQRGVGAAITPRAARFRHTAPASTGEHRRVFGPGVRFAEEHDELVIDRELLSRPQVQAEPALCEVLDRHLSALADRLPADGGFLERVSGCIVAELSRGEPTLLSIARRLHMSPRSLQRRLQQEGSSLQSLLGDLRADLAVRYLGESRESISEVAFLLGFSEVSTFHRAFKRWTGETPAAYRARTR
jgi:AraC-like DNA-binding protein